MCSSLVLKIRRQSTQGWLRTSKLCSTLWVGPAPGGQGPPGTSPPGRLTPGQPFPILDFLLMPRWTAGHTERPTVVVLSPMTWPGSHEKSEHLNCWQSTDSDLHRAASGPLGTVHSQLLALPSGGSGQRTMAELYCRASARDEANEGRTK